MVDGRFSPEVITGLLGVAVELLAVVEGGDTGVVGGCLGESTFGDDFFAAELSVLMVLRAEGALGVMGFGLEDEDEDEDDEAVEGGDSTDCLLAMMAGMLRMSIFDEVWGSALTMQLTL